jgi:hypothetical protein
VKQPWWPLTKTVYSGLVLGVIFSGSGVLSLVELLAGSASLWRLAATVLYFGLASACFLSSTALRRSNGSVAGPPDHGASPPTLPPSS